MDQSKKMKSLGIYADLPLAVLDAPQRKRIRRNHEICSGCNQHRRLTDTTVNCSIVGGNVSLLVGRCKLRKWPNTISGNSNYLSRSPGLGGKCFIVLGMHRSATSLIAKSLHEGGVNMGSKFIVPNSGNPKGYFENIEIVRLNDEILSAAGGSWKQPPHREAILRTGFEDEIKEIVATHAGPLWGWKDPRSILTIEKYLPYIQNPHFVCCFRHPRQVAESLSIRDDNSLPFSEGLVLAKEYNTRLLRFLQSYGGGEFFI